MVQEQMRACDMLPKYAGVDARYQCTQFSWSEEFARPAAEVRTVVAQACRKHSYLIATTHFEPPLPFLLKLTHSFLLSYFPVKPFSFLSKSISFKTHSFR